MTNKAAIVVILVASAALWPMFAVADEEHAEHADHAEEGEHTEGADHHGEGHHEYQHGLALFLGGTDEPHHGTDFTTGLEYAYRLSPKWAVGGLVDHAGPDQRNWVIAPMVQWKPTGGGFTLLAAPGIEVHDGRGEHVDPHLLKEDAHGGDPDESFFVMRFGAAYWFHVGSRYGIGPAVNLDLVDGEEVWVYGVNFEIMF